MSSQRRPRPRAARLAGAAPEPVLRLARQEPKALHQRVAEQLRAAITAGELRPGTHLVEAEIAEQVGVSRGPVREALRALERDGLVVTYPYRGTYVLGASVEEIIALFVPLRLAVEQFAARALVAGDRAAIAAALEATIADLPRGIQQGDAARVVAADIAFHRAICHGADHPLVTQLWNLIEPRIELIFRVRYAGLDLARQAGSLAGTHQAIVDALRAGDAERLMALLRRHITNGMEQAVRAAAAQPRPPSG